MGRSNEKELFTFKESKRYPGLFVKKYTRRVFYDGLWTPELMESRGHVYNREGKLVVNPFTKIFNRGEQGMDIDRDEQVVAVRKVNGFMASLTAVPNYGIVVSTTGSLDSPFVEMAEEILFHESREKFIEKLNDTWYGFPEGLTLIFEICHEKDPHIIKEKPGAYLLGERYVDDGPVMHDANTLKVLDKLGELLGVYTPKWKEGRFSDIVSESRRVIHEGFVVYSKDKVLKLKSPHYLVLKLLARKKDILKINKMIVDEEFYSLIEYVKRIDGFNELEEQARLDLMIEFLIFNKGM